jgi:hypothetical protein
MRTGTIGRAEKYRRRQRLTAERDDRHGQVQIRWVRVFTFTSRGHGGVVAMAALGGEHVRLDQLVERRQRGRAGTDMAAMVEPESSIPSRASLSDWRRPCFSLECALDRAPTFRTRTPARFFVNRLGFAGFYKGCHSRDLLP